MRRESYSRLHPPPNLNVDKVECKVPSWASHQKTTTLKFGVGGEADRACIGKTCNKTSDIDCRLKNSTLGRKERSKSLRCKILTGILLSQVASNTCRASRCAPSLRAGAAAAGFLAAPAGRFLALPWLGEATCRFLGLAVMALTGNHKKPP